MGKTGDWARANAQNGLFVPSSAARVGTAYANIIESTRNNSQFLSHAASGFASGADGWLIAYASVYNMTIVTEEVYDPRIRRRIPIPNVCKQFNVPYINTFDMLKQLAVQFTWSAP